MNVYFILSIIFIVLFAWIAMSNMAIAVRWYVLKKRSSMIPIIGGLIGVAGFVISPTRTLNHLWWMPIIADLGCGLMLIALAFNAIRSILIKK
jgi:hypothetical protein